MQWLMLVVLVISGCSGDQSADDDSGESRFHYQMPSDPQFRSLLPVEAKQIIDAEEALQVVDVRTIQERDQSRIAGSISAPFSELMQGQIELPRDRPLLLVSSVGGKSYGAGLYLMREGYLQVYTLRGGMLAWEKAGLPLELVESSGVK